MAITLTPDWLEHWRVGTITEHHTENITVQNVRHAITGSEAVLWTTRCEACMTILRYTLRGLEYNNRPGRIIESDRVTEQCYCDDDLDPIIFFEYEVEPNFLEWG